MTDRYDWETDELALHDYQRDSVRKFDALAAQRKMPRMCLYYKTGTGKTITALACMYAAGQRQVLVIAPPTTHTHWRETGAVMDIEVEVMSHAMFRKPEKKVSRTKAIIVDEFHMLGGYKAAGFKKLERLAAKLMAPVVIASATPNYNDVERCYCIQRITDRRATEGGYLSFIYRHCDTEVNPFGHVPRVKSFTHYPGAPEFLADLPYVEYIEDDLVYDIEDVPMQLTVPAELLTYGLDRRNRRMVASLIEMKHTLIDHMLVPEGLFLADEVTSLLHQEMKAAPTPVLIFALHRGVATSAVYTLRDFGFRAAEVHGQMTRERKNIIIEQFKNGELDALVGTQTLATGTDGLDKMCDVLVILDDTEDNAMRRQLVGRIMPRGDAETVAHSNRVVRVLPEPSPGP